MVLLMSPFVRVFEQDPLDVIYLLVLLHHQHLFLLHQAFKLLIHFLAHVVLYEKAMLGLLLRS